MSSAGCDEAQYRPLAVEHEGWSPTPIVREFTHQSEAFNAAPAMRSADTLGRLLELIPAAPGERWLDAACGPGLVARGLAARVGRVDGVDMTPAMVALARREAQREGAANAVFSIGDATALEFEPGSFDGAVTRFSLHHIPVPGRVVAELAGSCARAVRSSWPTTSPRRTATSPPGIRRSSACATRRTGRVSRRRGCARWGSGPGSCSSASWRRRFRSTSRSGSPAAAAARPRAT